MQQLPIGTLDPAQMVTILSVGGIGFQGWEIAQDNNSPREVFAREREQNRGTLRFVVEWAQRLPFAALMIGGAVATTGGTLYNLPLSYPDVAGWICLYIECRPVAPQGATGRNSALVYQYADLLLHYGPPPYTPGQFSLGVLEMSTQSHAIAMAQEKPAFFWDTGATEPLPPSMMPALHWTSTLLTLERTDQPALPISTVQNLVDKTNEGVFYGYAAETVLFHGATSKWRMNAYQSFNGAPVIQGGGGSIVVYDCRYLLEAHSVSGGWNMAYKPDTGLWTPFYNAGGTKLFPTADFSPLIAP